MKQIAVNFPEELAFHLRMKNKEFDREIKKIALIKLYELEKISSGKAASILGISRVAFLDLLNEYGVSIFGELDEEILEDQLKTIRQVTEK
jgi:predicted HTH domain antitoxin